MAKQPATDSILKHKFIVIYDGGECTLCNSIEEVNDTIREYCQEGCAEDELKVYELGRIGILPKREIMFI